MGRLMDIRLDKETFWKFNDGSADRFGFFNHEAQYKLETEEKLIDMYTAYNYIRSNREQEEAEWAMFYREQVDRLFRKYEYLVVKPDGQILGIRQESHHLIMQIPEAYEVAFHLMQ